MRDPLHHGDEGSPVLQIAARLEDDDVGRTTVDLACGLAQAGWPAMVASAGGSLQGQLPPSVQHLTLPLGRAGHLGAWLAAHRLADALRRSPAALMHAHDALSAWVAARVAGRRTIPYVTTLYRPPERALGPFATSCAEALLNGSRLIATSELVAEAAGAVSSTPRPSARIVPCGIDLELFDPQRVRGHRVAALAERWGLPAGTRVALLPGPILPGRGHEEVLRAIARLRRTDIVLLAAGPLGTAEPMAGALTRATATQGLAGQLRFGGPVEDWPAALMLADVVVLPGTAPDPSLRLGAEAQAMGRPLIVSDAGAAAESVMPAATGWLVPAGNVEELAWALDLALAMDEPARARLAARARSFIASTFARPLMTERMLAIYRELLAGTSR